MVVGHPWFHFQGLMDFNVKMVLTGLPIRGARPDRQQFNKYNDTSGQNQDRSHTCVRDLNHRYRYRYRDRDRYRNILTIEPDTDSD